MYVRRIRSGYVQCSFQSRPNEPKGGPTIPPNRVGKRASQNETNMLIEFSGRCPKFDDYEGKLIATKFRESTIRE